VWTHELGHNIGLNHASTDTGNTGSISAEYGDTSCYVRGSPTLRAVVPTVPPPSRLTVSLCMEKPILTWSVSLCTLVCSLVTRWDPRCPRCDSMP
jgi:hypothetical protein